jgi:O-glycosyl hydrolase
VSNSPIVSVEWRKTRWTPAERERLARILLGPVAKKD